MGARQQKNRIRDSVSCGLPNRTQFPFKPKWSHRMPKSLGCFYEFFAGGGMARAGLGDGWECLFANDIDRKKAAAYIENWGGAELSVCGVETVNVSDLPGEPELIWASFPCQDLSLAGEGAGLRGARSGTFWPFWNLVEDLNSEGRRPHLIVLENVCGALTSHDGQDFLAICRALRNNGYRYGAMVMDAAKFVPQSRPRLFIVAVDEAIAPPTELLSEAPMPAWTSRSLEAAYDRLTPRLRANWFWWAVPEPDPRTVVFSDLIEEAPNSTPWKDDAETNRLLSMMSLVNREKVEAAKRAGRRMVGGLYRRTRRNEFGQKVQRAEVRFDDVAGCLRTPTGGSSRQLLLVVEGERVRSRLVSPRETARLMGLPDTYQLPSNANEAYHLTGDGVVVPVVRHLAAHLLEPMLQSVHQAKRAVA